jgi:2-keto-4-pentenoate hydratase/2-oxohepta-3-ene-1,7-dioic acid hydratase in catechol pathway
LKLAHYVKDGTVRVGIVEGGRVFDLAKAIEESGLSNVAKIATIDQMLANHALDAFQKAERKITAGTLSIPVESAIFRTPILNPEKILLVARNYLSHNLEQNAKPPSEPYFFMKTRNALIGPGEPILIPKISSKVDWEGELAVIIAKTGKNIVRKDAMDYVAGYAVSIDISFRDLQFSTRGDNAAVLLGSNWVKGKNLDSSFPLGPWLVTKDEIHDPQNLELTLTVNGKTKQYSNTREMIFKIDALIEYVSAGMTLRAGDVISTGTPEGVAAFTGEPFLKDGDLVEATINGIGTLRNPVRSESD